jgi:hypothetical protein
MWGCRLNIKLITHVVVQICGLGIQGWGCAGCTQYNGIHDQADSHVHEEGKVLNYPCNMCMTSEKKSWQIVNLQKLYLALVLICVTCGLYFCFLLCSLQAMVKEGILDRVPSPQGTLTLDVGKALVNSHHLCYNKSNSQQWCGRQKGYYRAKDTYMCPGCWLDDELMPVAVEATDEG